MAARPASMSSRSPASASPQAPRPRRLDVRRNAERLAREAFDEARAAAARPLEEARAFDALALTELPRPTILELDVAGWSGPVWVRSALGRGPNPIPALDPVIDAPIWRAIALATAADRLRPVDLRAVLGLLAVRPGLGRDEPSDEASRRAQALAFIEAAIDGVPPSPERLTIGETLHRLGARLFSVRIEDEPATSFAPLAEAS